MNRRQPTDLTPGTVVTIRGATRATVIDTDTLPSGQRIVFVETVMGRRFPANLDLVAVVAS